MIPRSDSFTAGAQRRERTADRHEKDTRANVSVMRGEAGSGPRPVPNSGWPGRVGPQGTEEIGDRRKQIPEPPKKPEPYPTVLVLAEDLAVRSALKSKLEQTRCLVLEADCAQVALQCVISHSRPIHVLVVDPRSLESDSTLMLKRYRPAMDVLFLTADETGSQSDSWVLAQALEKVRELLNLPKCSAAGAA